MNTKLFALELSAKLQLSDQSPEFFPLHSIFELPRLISFLAINAFFIINDGYRDGDYL